MNDWINATNQQQFLSHLKDFLLNINEQITPYEISIYFHYGGTGVILSLYVSPYIDTSK